MFVDGRGLPGDKRVSIGRIAIYSFVGLVALIYALPFLLYFFGVLRLAFARRLPAQHKFMFCGLFCAFLATNTNPYIEAFCFQWMYVVPLVALFVEYPDCFRKAAE